MSASHLARQTSKRRHTAARFQHVPTDADSPAPVVGRRASGSDADRLEEAGVSVRGLIKSYGAVRALAGVDLEAAPGTVLGLLGPNGAGKTTIIRILTTLLKPDGGTARVAGLDVVRDAARLRERIGLAGQYAAVDENLTGLENLTMVGRLYGQPRAKAKQRGRELLERFELLDAAGRPTKTYSGGMRRRLDLAAALVARPPVLFLDEPTTGLDPRSRLQLWETIEQLVADGTTVLLTTQNLDEADRLATEIAVIDRGRVLAEGTPDELKDRVGGERLEVRLDDAAAGEVAASALASMTDEPPEVVGDLLTAGVRRRDGAIVDAVRRLDQAGVGIEDVVLRRPTLDDVFLALTGHAAEAADDDAQATA
jgi:ABC-2 type transport system ATP-binding protein